MEAISVKNLTVAYENNTIIEDMSLSIPKGKISIIIGANGCGKSTLLKTIARINKPKTGDIFINNKNIKKVKEKNIAKEERKNRRTWQGYYTRKTPTKKEKEEKIFKKYSKRLDKCD